jgi:ribonuclease HI
METIRVFTDGACSKNGKENAKASYACWFPEHKELSTSGRVPDDQPQTNNRGELMGILEAVKIINEKFNSNEVELVIYTDSQYSKNCLTAWLAGWIANNWKTSAGGDVKNRDLIEETTTLLRKFNYQIKYVPAHTGKTDELSKHNEQVDRMAVAVLNPEVENVKIVHTNTTEAIEGFPVELMGAPISEDVIVEWCKNNLNKLDQNVLNYSLLQVVTKTLKAKGFSLDKQKLYKRNVYRLTANNLIVEGTKVIKEE